MSDQELFNRISKLPKFQEKLKDPQFRTLLGELNRAGEIKVPQELLSAPVATTSPKPSFTGAPGPGGFAPASAYAPGTQPAYKSPTQVRHIEQRDIVGETITRTGTPYSELKKKGVAKVEKEYRQKVEKAVQDLEDSRITLDTLLHSPDALAGSLIAGNRQPSMMTGIAERLGGPGAGAAYSQLKGVQAGLGRTVGGFLEPSSLATLGIGGVALKGASPLLHAAAAAAFLGPSARDALEKIKAGDDTGYGELAGQLLGVAAFAGKGKLEQARAARAIELAKQIKLREPGAGEIAKTPPAAKFTPKKAAKSAAVAPEKAAEAAKPFTPSPEPPKTKTTQRKASAKKGETDAAKEGVLKQDSKREHKGDGEGGTPAQSGRSRSVQPAKKVSQQAAVETPVKIEEKPKTAPAAPPRKPPATKSPPAAPEAETSLDPWRTTFRKLRDEGKSIEEAGKEADRLHGERVAEPQTPVVTQEGASPSRKASEPPSMPPAPKTAQGKVPVTISEGAAKNLGNALPPGKLRTIVQGATGPVEFTPEQVQQLRAFIKKDWENWSPTAQAEFAPIMGEETPAIAPPPVSQASRVRVAQGKAFIKTESGEKVVDLPQNASERTAVIRSLQQQYDNPRPQPNEGAPPPRNKGRGRSAGFFDPFAKARPGSPAYRFREFAKSAYDQARNTFLEGGSRTKRTNRRVHEAASEVSGSYALSTYQHRIYVPEVLRPLSILERQQFQPYMIADRAITERNTVQADLAGAKARLQQAAAQGLPQSQLDKIGEEVRQLQKYWDENIINRNELATQTRFWKRAKGTYIDPVTKKPITEKDVEAFFKRRGVQEALRQHKALIEPIMDENRIRAGKGIQGDRGKYSGAFTPALAADASGEPISFTRSGGGGLSGPIYELPSIPGSREFHGTAENYISDYSEAVRQRMVSGTISANKYHLLKTMVEEGVAVDTSDKKLFRPAPEAKTTKADKSGISRTDTTQQYEMKIKGQWVKATSPRNIQEGHFGNPTLFKDLPVSIAYPADLEPELRPLFLSEGKTAFDDVTDRLSDTAIGLQVAGVGEVGSHSRGLTSRLSKGIPAIRGPAWFEGAQKTILSTANSAALLRRTLLGGVDLPGSKAFTTLERQAAAQEAAKAGALPGRFGLDPYTSDNPLQKATKFTGRLLYGDKGVLSNVHTSIYKYFKDSGLLDESKPDYEENVAAMRDLMRGMNTHTEYFASRLAGKGRVGGALLATFAQTGYRNRAAAFQGGLGKWAMRAAGVAVLTAVINKERDPQHRWPTEIPGYRLGDIYIKDDEDGRPIYFNILNMSDRTLGYSLQPINSLANGVANGDSANTMFKRVGIAVANEVLSPAASGPLPQVGSEIHGVAPYLTLNEKNQVTFLHNRDSDLPYTSPQKWNGIGQALLPIIHLGGERNMTTMEVQDAKLKIINRLLGLTGAEKFKAVDEGAIEVFNRRAQRREDRLEESALDRAQGIPSTYGRGSSFKLPGSRPGR